MNRPDPILRRYFRTLPKMLVLLALTLATMTSNACRRITGPTETGEKVLYGACGKQPNYASLVPVHRFLKFPVTVSINVNPSLAGSAKWVELYQAALDLGAGMWGEVMPDGIGQVVRSLDNPNASIQIWLANVAPLNGGGGKAETVRNAGIATSSRIEVYRYAEDGRNGPAASEQYVDRGLMTSTEWVWDLAGLVAHEMGHALMTNGHPPGGNIMSNPDATYAFLEVSNYRDWFTAADKNTMSEVYCR